MTPPPAPYSATCAAARLRRVGKATDGRGVEAVGDEDEIGPTGPATVLQPLIDAGDFELLKPDYYDPDTTTRTTWERKTTRSP